MDFCIGASQAGSVGRIRDEQKSGQGSLSKELKTDSDSRGVSSLFLSSSAHASPFQTNGKDFLIQLYQKRIVPPKQYFGNGAALSPQNAVTMIQP